MSSPEFNQRRRCGDEWDGSQEPEDRAVNTDDTDRHDEAPDRNGRSCDGGLLGTSPGSEPLSLWPTDTSVRS